MGVMHDPSNSWFFWALVVAAFAVSAFFRVSRNTALKRRWWPIWLWTTTVLFGVFGWYVAGVLLALFLTVASVLLNWRLLKRMWFCDHCGSTVMSYSLVDGPLTSCPSCGAPLGRAA